MKRYAAALVWLTFVWIALWRDLSWGNLLAGVGVAVALLLLFPFPHSRYNLHVHPLALLRFLGVFVWSVLKANVIVAWEVITPGSKVREGIVAVEIDCDHPVVITMVNHAVNLAPGTFVIETDSDPTVLYVHVLHLEDPADVRESVEELADLAIAAFGITRRSEGVTS